MTNSGVLTSVYTISANRSHLNGTQNTTVHGSSVTVNLGFTPAAGTLLVVGCTMESSSYTMSISDNSSGPADSWTNATVLPQTSWDSGTWSMQAWAINVTSWTGPTTVTMTASHVTNDLVCVVDNYIGGPNPFVRDGVAAVATGLSNTPSV